MTASEPPSTFWNRRYEAVERLWTPSPNAPLVEFAAGLQPARALDLGAGEGRNAIWLAKQGWRVTALDVSSVGLARAAARATEEGVEIECLEGDWREYRPAASSFELGVISFMHPDPSEQGTMFGRVIEALVPGGHLFTVGVHRADHGRRGPPDPERLYTPDRLRRALRGMELLRCEPVTYEAEGKEGPRRVTDVFAIAKRSGRR